MDSASKNAEQQEVCLNYKFKIKHNMETPNHILEPIFDEELYTIEWSDIENTEIDYENYLNDIENFFREDFENDILEEEDVI